MPTSQRTLSNLFTSDALALIRKAATGCQWWMWMWKDAWECLARLSWQLNHQSCYNQTCHGPRSLFLITFPHIHTRAYLDLHLLFMLLCLVDATWLNNWQGRELWQHKQWDQPAHNEKQLTHSARCFVLCFSCDPGLQDCFDLLQLSWSSTTVLNLRTVYINLQQKTPIALVVLLCKIQKTKIITPLPNCNITFSNCRSHFPPSWSHAHQLPKYLVEQISCDLYFKVWIVGTFAVSVPRASYDIFLSPFKSLGGSGC